MLHVPCIMATFIEQINHSENSTQNQQYTITKMRDNREREGGRVRGGEGEKVRELGQLHKLTLLKGM